MQPLAAGRFCAYQRLETVLRCHASAFDACGGATREVLYDRMKTAVIGEDADGSVVYNPSLVALLDHYGSAPRACKAYQAKTKGKVERPFRFIRQDFFLDRSFRNLDDLNAQFAKWLREVASPRVHATTGRIVEDRRLIAQHPVLEGRNRRRVDPGHWTSTTPWDDASPTKEPADDRTPRPHQRRLGRAENAAGA